MVSTATFRGTPDDSGRNRWWFIGAGTLLLLLGIAGLFMVITLTVASTLWYGVLLLTAGIVEIGEASRGLERPRHGALAPSGSSQACSISSAASSRCSVRSKRRSP